jgi:V/A-type H+-transporting ATPase subunit D
MSPPRLAVPPGRAGRIWLVRRLQTARRGADLLDRQLRILEAELTRRQAAAAEAAARWDQCQAAAQAWLLRTAMLSGERAIRLADDGHAAELTISYATTMGIRYPSGSACSIPPAQTWDGPVMARTRQAYRAALAAAADHAAAAKALAMVEDEVRTTRYRLRAVQDRWIPRLDQALADVTFTLEELERADAARLRLAAGRAGSSLTASQPGSI